MSTLTTYAAWEWQARTNGGERPVKLEVTPHTLAVLRAEAGASSASVQQQGPSEFSFYGCPVEMARTSDAPGWRWCVTDGPREPSGSWDVAMTLPGKPRRAIMVELRPGEWAAPVAFLFDELRRMRKAYEAEPLCTAAGLYQYSAVVDRWFGLWVDWAGPPKTRH